MSAISIPIYNCLPVSLGIIYTKWVEILYSIQWGYLKANKQILPLSLHTHETISKCLLV